MSVIRRTQAVSVIVLGVVFVTLAGCGGSGGAAAPLGPLAPAGAGAAGATAVSVQPAVLDFGNVGSSYAATFRATTSHPPLTIRRSSTCTTDGASLGRASVAPSSGPSGQSFSVTPRTAGTCAITVVDAAGNSAMVSVNTATTVVTGQ